MLYNELLWDSFKNSGEVSAYLSYRRFYKIELNGHPLRRRKKL